MSGSVHIVIVNWNTGEHLRDCLRSINVAADGEHVRLCRVTVVDNASSDGSADGLEGIPLPVEVIHNHSNVGFGAACNQGAAGSAADYLLFLNPDTRLLDDTLSVVTSFMDSDRSRGFGICGAEVIDPAGEPGISCERFPTLRVILGKMTKLDRILPRAFPSHHLDPSETSVSGPVDQVIGAFYMVRREVFTRLGGFDTRYFIYFEDVDFAKRALSEGFGTYFLKEAKVVHAANVSSDQVRDFRLFHSLRSRLLYASEHWPRWQAILLVPLTLGVELPARLGQALSSRSRSDFAATLGAYRMLLSDPLFRRWPGARWR
jgi:N-acetylglucosaminyl-diphospho-decaprenol L-rhamnosyltransferase